MKCVGNRKDVRKAPHTPHPYTDGTDELKNLKDHPTWTNDPKRKTRKSVQRKKTKTPVQQPVVASASEYCWDSEDEEWVKQDVIYVYYMIYLHSIMYMIFHMR